jgi:hypothetical protein
MSDLTDDIVRMIRSVPDIWDLNGIGVVWEERMKELAAEILKPDSDDVISEDDGGLHALDYIWHLGGDRCAGGDQVFHRSALDYYIGRRVEHVWGEGVLVRFIREDEPMLPQDRKHFEERFGRKPTGLWLSDALCDRGYKHGIALKFPCQCGKVEYDMFAIPGVHTAGFAYLICEEYDNLLDVRNQCRVCDDCAEAHQAALDAIDEKYGVGKSDE